MSGKRKSTRPERSPSSDNLMDDQVGGSGQQTSGPIKLDVFDMFLHEPKRLLFKPPTDFFKEDFEPVVEGVLRKSISCTLNFNLNVGATLYQ